MKRMSKAKGGHPTLSKETVEKLLQQDKSEFDAEANPHAVYIGPWDILGLERCEAENSAAMARYDMARMTQAVAELQAQLASMRCEHQRREVETFETKHRKLADELAAKYGFEWSTHSYNTETGEVTET